MKKPALKKMINGIKRIPNAGAKAMGTLIQKGGAQKAKDMGGKSKAKVQPATTKAPAKGTFNAKRYEGMRRKVFGMGKAREEDAGKI